MRTVKAYCLNVDLKCIVPRVSHFFITYWFYLEVIKRIWKIPFFKCPSTDHSHTFISQLHWLSALHSQKRLPAWRAVSGHTDSLNNVKGWQEVLTLQTVDSLRQMNNLTMLIHVPEVKALTCCCSHYQDKRSHWDQDQQFNQNTV